MNTLIKINNLVKSYDGKTNILDGLDFTADCGDFIVIRGESGSGKSTLLNIIGLLDTFSSGEYTFKNIPILPAKTNRYNGLRSEEIGFVFQTYQLIEALDAKNNILMPFMYNNKPVTKSVYKNLDELAGMLNITHLLDKKAGLLSGGECQRVSLCRALLKNPSLIIADEPTGNLDEKTAASVLLALENANKNGTTVILVTHNIFLHFKFCKEFYLQKGRLHQSDSKCI